MKKYYRIVAGVLAALGGFAAIGARLMIVATAIAIGVLAAVATRLAVKGMGGGYIIKTGLNASLAKAEAGLSSWPRWARGNPSKISTGSALDKTSCI